MTRGTWRRIVASGVAAGLITVALPAAAQNYSPGYKLLQAVEKNDRTEFDKLVAASHTVINSRDITNGRTGLHIAASRRDIVWLVYLANQGANPNIADNHGVTPIMLASQLGWFEGVDALIKAGAHVDDPNETGETPLILAVHRRDTQMIRALLRGGADPARADNSGRTARDYAEAQGRTSTTMAEIDRSARTPTEHAAAGETYGPN